MMKGRITWLVVSGLMVLSLLIAACAPAVVEKPPEVTEKPKPEVVEKPVVVEPTVEKPKYGGVLNVGLRNDITDFHDITRSSGGFTLQLTNEPLVSGDWTKGPAGGYGTNETPWHDAALHPGLKTGYVAESFELPKKMEGDKAAIIYHIRKGVRYALNPQRETARLVGGRELTVDDVLYSLNLVVTDSRAHVYISNKELRVAQITSPEPWTVKVEVPWEAFESAELRLSGYVHIMPKEVYEKWGPLAFADWKNSVGTGPFILVNNVPGSSATLLRNPNYWMKNPIGPGKGDQLPYVDGVKLFIIPDTSTRLAALRTGRIDTIQYEDVDIAWEEGVILKKTSPSYMKLEPGMMSGHAPIQFKLDRPPFNDIRVRRAMMMALDFETVNKELYDGLGLIHSHPIGYPEDFREGYLALDDPETPPSVKELYVYNPTKAKQLLAEAGYPNGFKTNLIIGNSAEEIDYMSIYKDMWSKTGVDVELRPKETGALETIRAKRDFDGMIRAKPLTRVRTYQMYWRGTADNNMSDIDDPKVNEAFDKLQSVVLFDRAEAGRIFKELQKYALDQVWGVPVVMEPSWTFWPSWLKNYSGEWVVGAGRTQDFYRWIWIDQELKKSLGY